MKKIDITIALFGKASRHLKGFIKEYLRGLGFEADMVMVRGIAKLRSLECKCILVGSGISSLSTKETPCIATIEARLGDWLERLMTAVAPFFPKEAEAEVASLA